jgi:hypothetical protein
MSRPSTLGETREQARGTARDTTLRGVSQLVGDDDADGAQEQR